MSDRAGAGRGGNRGAQAGQGNGEYDTFEEGTVANAGQYIESMKEVIQWLRQSGRKEADLIADSIENETIAFIAPPAEPVGEQDPNNPGQLLPVSAAEQAIYQEEIRMTAKRRANLREGLPWAATLKGQCSPSLWGELTAEDGFEQVEMDKNPVELKHRINGICCGFQAHKQRVYAVAESIFLLATSMQQSSQSLDKFYREFTARWDMIEQFGGSLTEHTGLIEDRATEIAASDDPPRAVGEVDEADRAVAKEEIAD